MVIEWLRLQKAHCLVKITSQMLQDKFLPKLSVQDLEFVQLTNTKCGNKVKNALVKTFQRPYRSSLLSLPIQ